MLSKLCGFRAAFAFWLALSATTSPAAAIVGPSRQDDAASPHVVMILNHVGRTAGFCSAVVVAPDVVMTAAHCVPPGGDLRVYDPASGGQPVLLAVAGSAIHPEYRADAIKRRERSIDLALVRLQAPLPAFYKPATVSQTSQATLGDRFRIMGFGVGREGDAASSGVLRSATLAARAPLSSVLLWAEDPAGRGAGACTGDSGAPVTPEGQDGIVAMVVWSAGSHGLRCGSLTQSLWLAPQRAWIGNVLDNWRSPTPQK